MNATLLVCLALIAIVNGTTLFCFSFCCYSLFIAAATVNVDVGPSGSFSFSPASITIAPNDTVTYVQLPILSTIININTFRWTWKSSGHSVTSGSDCSNDNAFGSTTLQDSGATTSHTFAAEGTFNYFCVPHCGAGMKGTVKVVAGGASTTTSAGSSVIPLAILSVGAVAAAFL